MSAELRRAVGVEARLHADQLRGMAILSVISLLLACFVSDFFSSLAVVWAALGWYRWGRTDSPERGALIAALGISRAARLRARVLLVVAESAALVMVGAGGGLLRWWNGDPVNALLATGSTSVLSQLGLYVLGTVLNLLVVAVCVGRECMTRTPSRWMSGVTLLVYLAGMIISAVLTGVTGWVRQEGERMSLLSPTGWSIAIALGMVVLLTVVLRQRVGAWVRSLNGPPSPQ